MTNLAARLLAAIIGLPILLAAIWLGDPWYTLLLLAVAAAACWEFHRIARAFSPGIAVCAAWPGALLLVADSRTGGARLPLIVTAAMLLALVLAARDYARGGSSEGWLWGLGGALYVGLPLWFFGRLRGIPDGGTEWVLLAILTTFASDTAAYTAGRLFGRHKLAPAISPAKTWEGGAGAIAGAALAAPALAALLSLPLPWHLWLLGPLLGIAAQAGDLAESVLKRGAGVKDAGAFIPGHGGILDRLDSLVFVVPAIYYYATAIVGGYTG